jgi:hypothetical protein
MERQATPRADGSAVLGPWGKRLGLIVLLSLIAWQGWMTLSLFGAERTWAQLVDDQPILSGRHPLHLYHGYLGARSFAERGTLCCYDPAFQAGYPKTPVFDSGSRPAELFLSVTGGTYRPAAYKVGLAVCCLAVPLLLALAAWSVGLDLVGTCMATTLGLLVWWGSPCRAALEVGNLDLLLAALAAVVHVGLIVRFNRAPGLGTWVGLLASGLLGWFAQPLFFALLFPLDLIYYLSIGAKHRLIWHLALLAALVGGVAGNTFWLIDWVTYWWIRSPLANGVPLLGQRSFHAFWTAPVWGDPLDRAIALVLGSAAVVGICLFNQTGQRPAARLLGLGAGGLLILAVAGMSWEPLARFGTSRLLVPAALFAAPAAGHAFSQGWRWLGQWLGSPRRSLVVGCGVLFLAGLEGQALLGRLPARCTGSAPLAVGLGPRRQALVDAIVAHTGRDARILWEDLPDQDKTGRWTALLPVLTDRLYLGGLVPDGAIEHAYPSLADGKLAGRSLTEWNDADLEDFCRRYNVGWVMCWSSAAVDRFRAWKVTQQMLTVDEGHGYLCTLRPRSFVLKGQARVLRADCERIALADVVPEDGQVVLSLHYQAGLRASPGRVRIEREYDPYDPIPFIRLQVPGPVALITLTWEER